MFILVKIILYIVGIATIVGGGYYVKNNYIDHNQNLGFIGLSETTNKIQENSENDRLANSKKVLRNNLQNGTIDEMILGWKNLKSNQEKQSQKLLEIEEKFLTAYKKNFELRAQLVENISKIYTCNNGYFGPEKIKELKKLQDLAKKPEKINLNKVIKKQKIEKIEEKKEEKKPVEENKKEENDSKKNNKVEKDPQKKENEENKREEKPKEEEKKEENIEPEIEKEENTEPLSGGF